MGSYRFRSLTAEIGDRRSPLRAYLHDTFPEVRGVQDEYRAEAGPLMVPGGTASAATIGTAFDLAVRLVLDPDQLPDIATVGIPPALRPVVDDVARRGGVAARDARAGILTSITARSAWALALCVELYRRGPTVDSAIVHLARTRQFSPEELLALAPDDAVEQLAALHELATERLYPRLPVEPEVLALGPTFAGSHHCPADADLIVDGRLLDIKTTQGRENPKTGIRSTTLAGAEIYQIVGYALFDWPDTYHVESVGIYAARYGFLFERPLGELLSSLAGRPVDVEAERQAVWSVIADS